MNVPRLRFKDNDGKSFPDWEEKPLEQLALVERGKFSVRPRNDPRYFGGAIPFVQTGDIVFAGLYLTRFSQTLNEEGLKVSRLFPKNTILITIAANIGDTTITKFDVACTDSVVAIQPYDRKANPVWLKLSLDTKKDELDSQATQNAQKNINLQILKPLLLNIPSFPEQTKIANFLTAVDQKITQLTQKCDLLAHYKKGVMQQIFSQELRFKDDDGGDFPEWKETTLENCASFYRGGSLSKADIDINGKYDCVHYGELFTSYNEIIKIVKSKTNITNTFKSEFGDILMPSSDVTPAGLAKASCILKGGVVLGGDINIIRVKNTIKPIFISYLLNFEKNKIIQLVSGTTVKHIYIKDIKCIDISIPSEIAEQTKIANFLTSIDDKIANSQAQLAAVRHYKQGLLQQMFV